MKLFTACFTVMIIALIAGCVSTHMKQYIGRDIRDVVIDSGPPVNVFDVHTGRRAFQFYWGGGTYHVPKTSRTYGNAQIIGSSVYYSENSIESGGYTVSSKGCLTTYITQWDANKKGWIVVDISYPDRLVC